MNSRDKGCRGERELAQALTEMGLPAYRTAQRNGLETPDVTTALPIHFEAKRTEALRIRDALNQAEFDAAPGHIPVVAWRANREPWTVIVRLDRLPRLARIITAALAATVPPA
jgi:Holliday junction resolvase